MGRREESIQQLLQMTLLTSFEMMMTSKNCLIGLQLNTHVIKLLSKWDKAHRKHVDD